MAKRRIKGSGSVFKRSNGYYVFKYIDATGLARTKSLRTKNKKEAEQRSQGFVKAIQAVDKEDVLFQSAQARKIINSKTLLSADVWDEFIKTKPTAGQGTLGNYERILSEFCKWINLERPSISSFTQIDLEIATSFMEQVWQSGVSANTYNYKRGAMGTITKALQNNFNIDHNWWLRTKRKKGVQQKRLPLTNKHVNKLLKLIDDKSSSMPYHSEVDCLIKLCLFAGMRLYDAVNLCWSNIDLANNYITYKPQKTQLTSGVSAQVPIFKPLLDALNTLISHEDKYVLTNVQAHYSRNPDYIKKKLLSIIHQATGTKHNNSKAQSLHNRSLYGTHSLRHTFATEAAKAGVSSIKLSRMLGDTIRTIDRFYVDVDLTKESLPDFTNALGNEQKKLSATGSYKQQLLALIDKLSEEKIKVIIKQLS